MQTQSNIEARLLSEYFQNRPIYEKIVAVASAEIEHKLINLRLRKKPWERIEVVPRVKDFNSAVNKLRSHREGNILEPSASLDMLNDMAGLKIKVFPNAYLGDVENIIKEVFPDAEADHEPKQIDNDYGNVIRLKYFVTLHSEYEINTNFEIQIVPFILDAFMDLEHDIIYKPDPLLPKKQLSSLMKDHTRIVIPVLSNWSKEFSRILKKYGSMGRDN